MYVSRYTLQEPIHSIGMESEKGGEEVPLLLLAHSPYKYMNMIQKHKSAGEFGGHDGGFVHDPQ